MSEDNMIGMSEEDNRIGMSSISDLACDRCIRFFPCLEDPARRVALGLKVALVALHLIFVAVLFIFDKDLIQKTQQQPWHAGLYLLLFVGTLAQYFITSYSSPGYAIDAMRAINEADALAKKSSLASKQPASSKNGGIVITIDRDKLLKNLPSNDASTDPWTKLVMDMYPQGFTLRSCTCVYCNIAQPPRARHCHDCDKCVLQFDHHCVWLGTCIGQENHNRFWWYICEEVALSIWTGILYISYLKFNITKSWWVDVIMILLLGILSVSVVFLALLLLFHSYLILTNQTTYELVRRRRISYLRGIPERVFPFSKGICRNMYNFCCSGSKLYKLELEAVPTFAELEKMSTPYTCVDLISCRCC